MPLFFICQKASAALDERIELVTDLLPLRIFAPEAVVSEVQKPAPKLRVLSVWAITRDRLSRLQRRISGSAMSRRELVRRSRDYGACDLDQAATQDFSGRASYAGVALLRDNFRSEPKHHS